MFVIIGIGIAIYNFMNATKENRFSMFDITDGDEEPDPLNRRFGKKPNQPNRQRKPIFAPIAVSTRTMTINSVKSAVKNYKNHIPDESGRKVGQSVAAASYIDVEGGIVQKNKRT